MLYRDKLYDDYVCIYIFNTDLSHTHACTHTYAPTHGHTHTHKHSCTYSHTARTCTHIRTHTQTPKHTHTHTHLLTVVKYITQYGVMGKIIPCYGLATYLKMYKLINIY